MRQEGRTIAVDTDLQVYLRQINEAPLLTADEEKALATIVRNGQRAAEEFAAGEIGLPEREQAEEKAAEAPVSSGSADQTYGIENAYSALQKYPHRPEYLRQNQF